MKHQLIYLHQAPDMPLVQLRQPEPSRVFLIAEVTTSLECKKAIAAELAYGNCLYFLAWGTECEAWHDAVDMAILERFDFEDIPEEHFIMTTWHECEPLAEALWFCKNSALHSSIELNRTVLLHVAPQPKKEHLLEQFIAA